MLSHKARSLSPSPPSLLLLAAKDDPLMTSWIAILALLCFRWERSVSWKYRLNFTQHIRWISKIKYSYRKQANTCSHAGFSLRVLVLWISVFHVFGGQGAVWVVFCSVCGLSRQYNPVQCVSDMLPCLFWYECFEVNLIIKWRGKKPYFWNMLEKLALLLQMPDRRPEIPSVKPFTLTLTFRAFSRRSKATYNKYICQKKEKQQYMLAQSGFS